jgi:photosystem II stability/assembly factor-like uncharacterized protein
VICSPRSRPRPEPPPPRVLVGTERGLFTAAKRSDGWSIERSQIKDWNVTAIHAAPERRLVFAAAEMVVSFEDSQRQVHSVCSLALGGPDAPNVLWCGTELGAVLRSEDLGASWNRCESLWRDPRRLEWTGAGGRSPGVHSIVVDPRDARHVLVGVSSGGIWSTSDAGATWECTTDGMRGSYLPPNRAATPHLQRVQRVVSCREAPDVLWCQHFDGVFVSRDFGLHWTEVLHDGGHLHGFTVAVHPTNPDVAWLVPVEASGLRVPLGGSIAVLRTRDGGRTFEELRGGLPREHAYDIVFRHGLDVKGDGRTLAMGSTTGHLWITEDGGDRWAEVAAHLPPVQALRFA